MFVLRKINRVCLSRKEKHEKVSKKCYGLDNDACAHFFCITRKLYYGKGGGTGKIFCR